MSLNKLNKINGNTVLGIDSSTNSFAFCLFDKQPKKWGKVIFKGETVIDRIIDANNKINSLEILTSNYVNDKLTDKINEAKAEISE